MFCRKLLVLYMKKVKSAQAGGLPEVIHELVDKLKIDLPFLDPTSVLFLVLFFLLQNQHSLKTLHTRPWVSSSPKPSH